MTTTSGLRGTDDGLVYHLSCLQDEAQQVATGDRQRLKVPMYSTAMYTTEIVPLLTSAKP